MQINVNRNTVMDPLGAELELPQQIDIKYHELDMRISEIFVLVESLNEHNSVLGDAGLRAGDAILSINGKRFDTFDQFVALCREKPNLAIEYVRLSDIPIHESYVRGVKRAVVKRITMAVEAEATIIAKFGTHGGKYSIMAAEEARSRQYGMYTSESEGEHIDDALKSRQKNIPHLRDFLTLPLVHESSDNSHRNNHNSNNCNSISIKLGKVQLTAQVFMLSALSVSISMSTSAYKYIQTY